MRGGAVPGKMIAARCERTRGRIYFHCGNHRGSRSHSVIYSGGDSQRRNGSVGSAGKGARDRSRKVASTFPGPAELRASREPRTRAEINPSRFHSARLCRTSGSMKGNGLRGQTAPIFPRTPRALAATSRDRAEPIKPKCYTLSRRDYLDNTRDNGTEAVGLSLVRALSTGSLPGETERRHVPGRARVSLKIAGQSGIYRSASYLYLYRRAPAEFRPSIRFDGRSFRGSHV